MQDQSQFLPNPLQGCNSTGRDRSVNSQSSGLATGPKHSCHPPTYLATKKGGRAIPCFQLALLINHRGMVEIEEKLSTWSRLEMQESHITGIFLGPFCRSWDKGNHPVSTEASHFKGPWATGCIPPGTLATGLEAKPAIKPKSFLLSSLSHFCTCPFHRHWWKPPTQWHHSDMEHGLTLGQLAFIFHMEAHAIN